MNDETRDAIDLLDFVTRSASRVQILETLLEADAASRAELQSAVDVVRTTLQRNLDGLAERGLIRERDRQYEITPTGILVASGVRDSLALAAPATRLRPVLERIPVSELDLDPELLTDATVVEATTANPYAPVKRHEMRMAETDHARLVLPAVGADPVETAQETASEGAVHELIVTPDVVETMRTDPSFEEHAKSMIDTATVTMSLFDGEIPYYLGILDDIVEIGVHDESGLPTALLESTNPAVREWAIERFEEYQRRSDPL